MLQELRRFEIGCNFYTGWIPWQLGNMSKLDLLSGSLPVELGKLQKLNILFLYNNTLIGFIPWQLSNITCMEALDLSNNMLIRPIPKGSLRLKRLAILNIV